MCLDDYLYWTDWQDRSVERVHKKTGLERSFVAEEKSDIMSLIVVDTANGYQGNH